MGYEVDTAVEGNDRPCMQLVTVSSFFKLFDAIHPHKQSDVVEQAVADFKEQLKITKTRQLLEKYHLGDKLYSDLAEYPDTLVQQLFSELPLENTPS